MADHYFSDHPDSRSDIREISYGLGSISMRFLTDHGVFRFHGWTTARILYSRPS